MVGGGAGVFLGICIWRGGGAPAQLPAPLQGAGPGLHALPHGGEGPHHGPLRLCAAPLLPNPTPA